LALHPENRQKLEDRVVAAAEAALADHLYVSAIDVLTGMGLLAPTHVVAWRKGRVPFLESVIQGNVRKISESMAIFRQWARARGLNPSETRYVRRGPGGPVDLQFSKGGHPDVEMAYRTYYVSPVLAEHKREKLREKLSQPPDLVVFWILRDSKCSECGVELPEGGFLCMEKEQPLCLACAGLGELEYLPAGDAALTRRAKKYSQTSAVVVRFSRTRGRYERQGILVEEAGLRQAEVECAADAGERARQRERDAARRLEQDRRLADQMTERIRELFPHCPPEEARAIASHTAERGSGRVGRSAAGRALDGDALRMAVVAAVRHNHTGYDDLLARGADRAAAREQVRDRVEAVLQAWQ
jgi:hypothetical protein